MNLPRRTEEMPLSNCRFQSAGWQVSSVWSGFLIHNLSLKGLFYSFWFASFIRVLFITTVSTSWMCTISGTAKSVAWTDTCSLLKKAALIKYYHLICIAGPDNYTHTFTLPHSYFFIVGGEGMVLLIAQVTQLRPSEIQWDVWGHKYLSVAKAGVPPKILTL